MAKHFSKESILCYRQCPVLWVVKGAPASHWFHCITTHWGRMQGSHILDGASICSRSIYMLCSLSHSSWTRGFLSQTLSTFQSTSQVSYPFIFLILFIKTCIWMTRWYHVNCRFYEEEDLISSVPISSKKLLDMGFSFKYGLAEIFDDSIEFAKKLGLLP